MGTASLPIGSSKTVLLVDDEPMIRGFVKLILQKSGFVVVEAQSGVEALSFLRQNPPACVDLLVTDIVMPGEIDGVALARNVMVEHPKTGVVLMSGHFETSNVKLESNGRWAFVPKPFSPQRLSDAIQRVLAGPEPDSPAV
jgi:DNA-binding NtrC family response regulator